MPSFSRLGLVAALAIACHGALAQTAVPPTLTVQQLAPQLVTFAGSESNFQSLVNGLALGTPVQLLTVLPNGFTQVVSFTPNTALTPSQVAQVLESARQQLIGLGIGAPTAEQIGFTLMGGVVPTALGGTQVAGVLNPQNPPSIAAQIQSGAAAGATAPVSNTPAVTSTVNVQIFPSATSTTATTSTTAPRNTSDSLQAAGATSRSAIGTTSASPPTSTSTSPVATTPTSPGAAAAATPPTAERVPPGTPKARF